MYTMTITLNNGTKYVGIKSPYIAQISDPGDQYMFFKDHLGVGHIHELGDEPNEISAGGLQLVKLIT